MSYIFQADAPGPVTLRAAPRFTGHPGHFTVALPGVTRDSLRVVVRLRTPPAGLLAMVYHISATLASPTPATNTGATCHRVGTAVVAEIDCTNLLHTACFSWSDADQLLTIRFVEMDPILRVDAEPPRPTALTPFNVPLESPRMKTPLSLQAAVQTLRPDASDAAWRMAGSQFLKLAKEPLVALLARHLDPDDESLRGKIAAFLDTELGAALLSSVLSVGLSALPLPPNDVSQRLARELRIAGMARAGDAVADVLMGPLREVAVMYLQGVPTTDTTPQIEPPHATVLHPVEATVDDAAVPRP